MEDLKYKGIIPQKLIEDIKRGRCILFVGAGLSSQVLRSNNKSLPTWKSLLYEMLEWADENRTPFWNGIEDVKEMIDKNNLTVAAQELQDIIGGSNIGEFYKSVFRDKNVKPSRAHKIIPSIPFRAVITTNYDTLIEGGYSLLNEGILPPVFTQNDLDDKNSFLRNNEFFIFKMHGHIDRLDSIILGKRSYDDILFKNVTYRQFMETIFSVYTILFVGFGGNDDDLNNTFDKLSILYSRTLDKHYMLAEKGKYNMTEKRRLILDKRIEIIEYESDNSHSQVSAFLNELNKEIKSEDNIPEVFPNDKKRKKVFLSSSAHDKDITKVVYNFLNKNDFNVFDFNKEVKVGDILVQSISKAIQEASIMIVLITKNSIKSTWVQSELQAGILKQISDKSMRVIPIIIGDVQIPSYLNQIVYLKVDNNFTENDLIPLLKSIEK